MFQKQQTVNDFQKAREVYLSILEKGKDFSKMKDQYAMFVDAVVSKQVCVSICMTLHLHMTLSNLTDNIVCTASF
jgi:hypothetical protein